MLRFWGDGSQESMDLVNAIRVRSTENFNWTFIFILAVVFYVYPDWPCMVYTGCMKSAMPSSGKPPDILCGP